jgi:PAS domain S-box-containing protein
VPPLSEKPLAAPRVDPGPLLDALPPPPTEAEAVPIESFFDTILDHLPLMVFIKEAKEFRLIRVNRRYEELYSVSRKDLLGKSNSDLLSKKDADYIRSKDQSVIEGRELVDIPEERLNIPGRGEQIFHTRKLPLCDETGVPRYMVCIVEDITERKRAEEARQRELSWIEEQNRLLAVIHELSTPVIPIHEGILVVPLVGHISEARSAQLLQTLLSGIQHHRAAIVLLDITGVAVIDAGVADHLIQATRAAELLGASCVLVGTSPEVARTMVDLGVDFGRLSTQRDLQAGILYALARQGKAIVERPSSPSRSSR